jgi:arylsulfatase
MTGRHPLRNGVSHTVIERERLTLDAVTLPQVLTKAGYQSGIFGKWHLGDEEPYQPHNRGFTETFIHGAGGIGQAFDCSCADVPGNRYFDPIIRHNTKFVQTEGFCTDVFFTAALGWIREKSLERQPFFAYIATNAPHDPFVARDQDKQRFLDLGFTDQQAGYFGMIENIDQNVGRLQEKLRQWKLLENTVVIFMSDNGMSQGGWQPPNKALGKTAEGVKLFPFNAGMRGLKGSPDEGGVRVPFFFQWEGRVEAGKEIPQIAAHIDLFPTIAALAGAELPTGQVEGRSLLPLIDGSNTEWPDRTLVTHTGRWPQFADPAGYQWKGASLRNQRFRLVNNEALYDMQADPGQTKNVIDQHPELVNHLRKEYDQWWKQTLPLLVNEQVPSSKIKPFHELFHAQQAADGIPQWQPRTLD